MSKDVPNTFIEHLYSFKKYSDERIFYLNFFYLKSLKLLSKIKFDLIIYHHSFAVTTNINRLNRNIKLAKKLIENDIKKVVFFQDECWYTDFYNTFINELNINIVFSVAHATEWKKIYNQVNFEKVKFYRVLTGYIDENVIVKLKNKEKVIEKRIDIFYRTIYNKPYHLGKFGNLKYVIAEVFNKNIKLTNLIINISTDKKDLVFGKQWYNLLLASKFTIGVESGASLLDRDGSIQKKVFKYIKLHPNAEFEEVEKECFNGLDGNLNLVALAPRHFEACITKTCQILVEGEYNGILKPWVHYIPLKNDFSNIEEVIEIIKNDNLREKITEQAYKDIVLSGEYSYSKFVNDFFKIIDLQTQNGKNNFKEKILFNYFNIIDKFNWINAFLFSKILLKFYNFILRNNFFNSIITRLRIFYKI